MSESIGPIIQGFIASLLAVGVVTLLAKTLHWQVSWNFIGKFAGILRSLVNTLRSLVRRLIKPMFYAIGAIFLIAIVVFINHWRESVTVIEAISLVEQDFLNQWDFTQRVVSEYAWASVNWVNNLGIQVSESTREATLGGHGKP